MRQGDRKRKKRKITIASSTDFVIKSERNIQE